MQKLVERFITYIKTDTQSDPESQTTPSTEKQWNLARFLAEELKQIGMEEVTIDENSYVMATLPSNVDYEVPTIGFIAHFDTSPDFSGENVNPQFIENYDGSDIVLNKEKNIVLSPSYFEDLLLYKGQTIITTDGTTLLGADDKAGIAEIVTAMEYLIQHPEIKHGKIRVGFTPDEEIGRGAHKFDVEKFGADWAYTMDGSQIGELEYESFNAAMAKVYFKGKSVHPGYAKNKMVNSLLIANKFISMLPENEIPQETSGREGFFHVMDITGDIENTTVQLIIRDHDRQLFEKRKETIKQIVEELNKTHKDAVTVEIKDQYFNMREKIEPVFHIVEVAEKAMKELGITPIIKPIRGGTDGSQLSFMGLPCPNIFAGGHNFHGKFEYVPVESLEKATQVIVNIAKLVAKK
ncbi:peptidase T [Capnocytophaga canis]|uniref:Peptidase T n=1 Tax=Capnocytophaga canis TaxID=1848903 RepID=A0A0B7HRR7_9FLAO|nr:MULTISPECIES: peptidase T [Capnocytophaga]ATA72238.1 peptidase T [Capnocytophaga sp. H4358]ATA74360.1 peptidase T [Capnocytophaga sp. H2931]CEN42391.1 peptidase T [Capnocytophaga canis]CEN53293.1 peptidase T [Capnocytophaga canis]